ncbi:MAG: bifunctional (p)ppGpp synthetase/guanosine-3',5'-bis(diphosphate) 3'-pyrophosphohydrolase [Candidatus Hydrogenedentes bacterium]|nr:bifunctional (p)ppGpp synthetase/guanosine-3',5'-bis(diphosphate) 3'-pyrophosphohydrolase [Candidatus Hydrogenedentota bacterium]
MRTHFAKLLKQLKKNWATSNLEVVRKAYRAADHAHHGQIRLSGEPYILHSILVAQILAKLGLDPVTCAAGLLHDVLEDTKMTRAELQHEFGDEIAALVDGVTKISSLHLPGQAVTYEVKQAQNIRKMLVATAKDVRVILIKLADRLHNIRTIEFLPRAKQERIARETLEIYSSLAHRLGINTWKWELEDHAFHVLMPQEYKMIAAQVATKRHEREAQLNETIEFLDARLTEAEVNARVIGRPKHLYSIFNKMATQGKDFNEVMDIQAVRIITQTEAGCYNALGVVHSLWTPVPGRLKDYIAMPKLNMYQGIHTTVMRENGKPMEIQIRSEEMDKTAREGIAAHWIYKEGQRHKDKKLDEQLSWLRQMYEWLKDAHAPEELMEAMRRDFKAKYLYVFTPKGEVKELQSGATPLDFAYLVHSDIGHHCIGAKVNGRMVPLRYHLQTGDVVEILTSKNQTPHLDWVDIVVTGRARTSIRQRLRELGLLEPVEAPHKHREARPHQVIRPLPRPVVQQPVRNVDEPTRQKMICIDGAKGLAVQFGKCCNAMPGHAVIGYVTKSMAVTVHRADCKSFANTYRDAARVVPASWEGDQVLETAVRVVTGPRPNVLADITNALRPMNIEILRAQYGPGDNGSSHFDFVFEAPDHETIERVCRTLGTLNGISQVTQLDVRGHAPRELAVAG